jgi:hypothetical protein
VPLPGGSADADVLRWVFAVANVDGQEIRALSVIGQPLTETVVWNEPGFVARISELARRPAQAERLNSERPWQIRAVVATRVPAFTSSHL